MTSNVRTPREHDLKVWPEFYSKLESGEKTFELRIDDRGYRAGDILFLREWNPRMEAYTGNSMRRRVTYLMSGLGLQKDFVVMALGLTDETSCRYEAAVGTVCNKCGRIHDFGPNRCAECQTPRLCGVERECLRNRYVRPSVVETEAPLQWRDGLPYVSGVIASYDQIVIAARSAMVWKRRLEEQIDYSGKLQRLIECYCAGESLPYPELQHYQLLMECRREVQAQNGKGDDHGTV